MYGNLVVCSNIGCVAIGGYHGGINMHGSSVGHQNDPTLGLNGGPLCGFPMGELLASESLSCPPSCGWWTKLFLGTCVGNLSLIWCILIWSGATIVIFENFTCC